MIPSAGAERERLAALSPNFSSHDGFNARLIDMRFESLAPYLKAAASCVELGASDGRMTRLIAEVVPDVTAVDGSETYVAAIRSELPHVHAVCSLFEDYDPGRRFDVVVLGHVLEHVEDPVAVLSRARALLRPGARALVTVPNAHSLHRQLGVAMGRLRSVTDLGEADRRIGHRRVYTRAALVADIERAGLRAQRTSGVFLKPLSNAQMERFAAPVVRGLYECGKRHPEMCAELLVVAVDGGA